jgi:hypothetical protein
MPYFTHDIFLVPPPTRDSIDFARASFVVEWALEWAKDKSEIPQYLIERLSRNLFEPEAADMEPATVADAIASAIIGSAMQAEVNICGQKMTVDKKGLQQKLK